jgi:hypothetical protein
MRVRITALALGCLPWAALGAPPIAEVVCAPRAELETRLTRDLRATLSGAGLRDKDAVMQIWTDPQGRWTLVQRYASGLSCILAMGDAWEAVGTQGRG